MALQTRLVYPGAAARARTYQAAADSLKTAMEKIKPAREASVSAGVYVDGSLDGKYYETYKTGAERWNAKAEIIRQNFDTYHGELESCRQILQNEADKWTARIGQVEVYDDGKED